MNEKGRRLLKLCAVDELEEDEPVQVRSEAGVFAIFRVGEDIYVTDDGCTHLGASLAAEGEQDGFTIHCGWHGGAFDIRTGAAIAAPCQHSLRTYPVTVDQGLIYVEAPSERSVQAEK